MRQSTRSSYLSCQPWETKPSRVSHRIFNAWGLGRKGINDGILVFLAMKEKRVRIALGTGMERYISNADAKEIIDTEMTPSFRKREFAEGLEQGLKRLMEEGRRFTARDGALNLMLLVTEV